MLGTTELGPYNHACLGPDFWCCLLPSGSSGVHLNLRRDRLLPDVPVSIFKYHSPQRSGNAVYLPEIGPPGKKDTSMQ